MGFFGKLFGIGDNEPFWSVRSSSLYGYGTTGGLQNGIDNLLTGNLDYAREKELQQISNAFSASEAQKARDFSASEAQKARDFSEYMSNSSYQRAMADMKASGINPALAISQGGASTPSAAMASTATASGASAHAGKSGQGFMALMTTLLGSAFKVATTSMVNEASMARTLANNNSAYRIADLNNDEKFYRDDAWRGWYDKRR